MSRPRNPQKPQNVTPLRTFADSADSAARPKRTFLTLAEFLAELDVPKSTFFRWKALGLAPRTYKLPNGQLRIRRSDFDAWLASREEEQAA
ncbi:helix-turn-helix transcriptional regulator [Dactylosporangium sp. CA-233914]|uniref:helix-turn-helix transcriptional regulator n=1 Tax=Dactylosporangium sp. CA-233914 TaxID=3239934 RepID=UPI003D92C62A